MSNRGTVTSHGSLCGGVTCYHRLKELLRRWFIGKCVKKKMSIQKRGWENMVREKRLI